MHGTIRLLSAVALAAALAGCAQTGRSANPLAWFRKPAAEQAAAPFKPLKGETASKETSKVASAEPAIETGKDQAPAAPAAKVTDAAKASAGGHDAETLALIDEELKHATAEERERLFAEWKSLDGAMVRQVIRIRKMVRDLESASPASQPGMAALPGTANPWQGNGSSSTGAADQVRILPLGSNPPPTPGGSPPDAQDLPTIQPASQTAALESPGVQATAAYGNAAPPAPVVRAIATGEPTSIGANGLPPSAPAAALPAAPLLSPGGSSSGGWADQVRQLVAAAELRAETARAGFLERPAGAPADETARRAYVESQVQLRLLYLMAGEQARAMQAIPGLDAADQEFWQQVLWGVSNYFDETALPNRSDRVSQTIEQLRTAVTRLQGEANLQLRNVAFCRKITSFGNFERFERDEFSPGDQVLVYAEVLNFKSVPRPADGMYNTQLKSTIEIFRAGQGQPAKRIEFDPTIDVCRSYRQDYFHTYDLKIPADVTLGPHVLKLTIEDLQSRKVATYSVNFTVR